ncbi:MAG TPA: hypothetical protein VJY62_19205 [Bacteroidia bacterium]|nr:hypothetical protein [Bacteroidia bacterium]
MKKNISGIIAIAIISTVFFAGCKKKEVDDLPATATHNLILKFKFDSTQTRLNAFGNVSTVPGNHSAQSPRFNKMSVHYIEFADEATTLLGKGFVAYHPPETTVGGESAIDFDQSTFAGDGETFFSMPLNNVAVGSYKYLRVSLAYQNYDINFRVADTFGNNYDFTGTLASFIGFNTYIRNYKIMDSTVTENSNKKQGYWSFEWDNPQWGLPAVSKGQAPAGATTVPNPISGTSPIPPGSCVVTGAFPSTFLITGNETQDIIITVSLSTKKSFEWVEHSTPGYYEPLAGDTVVDMGIRGLIPIVN